jgi:ribosomal protein RSM22 (predicted rRNA methylase)
MNDHDAIDAIAEILHQFADHQFDHFTALNKIAYVIGYNKIEHMEAKEK